MTRLAALLPHKFRPIRDSDQHPDSAAPCTFLMAEVDARSACAFSVGACSVPARSSRAVSSRLAMTSAGCCSRGGVWTCREERLVAACGGMRLGSGKTGRSGRVGSGRGLGALCKKTAG